MGIKGYPPMPPAIVVGYPYLEDHPSKWLTTMLIFFVPFQDRVVGPPSIWPRFGSIAEINGRDPNHWNKSWDDPPSILPKTNEYPLKNSYNKWAIEPTETKFFWEPILQVDSHEKWKPTTFPRYFFQPLRLDSPTRSNLADTNNPQADISGLLGLRWNVPPVI